MLTAAAYATRVGVSFLLLRYVRRRGRLMLASVMGVAGLIPVSGLAAQVVLAQLTETSPDAATHATAGAVSGATFLAVVVVWMFTAAVPPRPRF